MNYLVNGWLVQPELNRVVTGTEQIQLEPRTMRVLVYLIENNERVVSRDQLFDKIWPNVEVSNDSLTRTIVDIRSIFRKNPNSTEVIETVRKVGYRFIAKLEEQPATNPVKKQKTTLIWLALLLITTFSYIFTRSEISLPKLESIKPLTSKSGLEMSANYSHRGDRIAYYFHSLDDISKSGIEILSLDSGQTIRFDLPFKTYSPSWSWDDSKLSYRTFNTGQCLLFYYDFELDRHDKIGVCPGVAHREVLWIPGNQKLLVNARNTNDSAYQLWEVDIKTGQSIPSPGLPDSKLGLLFPTFSKNGHYLGFVNVESEGVVAKGLSPVSGSIVKFDWTAKAVVDEIIIDEVLNGFDFDIDDQYIVYSSAKENPRYKLWYSDFSHRKQILYQDSTAMTKPRISNKGHLVYEHRDIDQDIVRVDIEQRTSELLIDSTHWDMSPDYDFNNEKIIFMSTRTGKADIWLQNKINTTPVIVKTRNAANSYPQFSPTHDHITYISTDANGSDLFISDLEGNYLQHITDDEAQENYPTWSLDGNWLYYSKYTNGQTQLWKIDRLGRQSTQITDYGGARAQEILFSGMKSLIYSKSYSSNLWIKALPDGEERMLPKIKITSPTSWSINKGKIYFLSYLLGKTVLTQYDVKTEEIEQIIVIPNDMYYSEYELTISNDGQYALITVGSQLKGDLTQLVLAR